jgi:two-component system, OmpR family, sensor kinase
MRLLSLTNKYYLGLLVLLLVIWSVFLFLVLRFEVYDNVDEVLRYRKNLLIQKIQETGKLPVQDGFQDFAISPMKGVFLSKDEYSDTLVHKWRNSYDEYRKVNSAFVLEGETYSLMVMLPRLENDEMIDTLVYTVPVFLLLSIIGFSILVKRLNSIVWKPFYHLLEAFKSFRLDAEPQLAFDHSRIDEFNELQNGMKELMVRSREDYQRQRQFTENASHEIQTPLSIIQAKIEMMFQNPMEEKQSQNLDQIYNAAERLSSINQTLLMLAKIENQQFAVTIKVNVLTIVRELLAYFEEQAEKYQIKIELKIAEDVQVVANRDLFFILMMNLLKNAFMHNTQAGYITVSANRSVFIVENSGLPTEVSPDKIFDRFYTQSPKKGGVGLGLAIVKGIATENNWKIEYHQMETLHRITIYFIEKTD